VVDSTSVDSSDVDPVDPVNLMRDRLVLSVSGLPAAKWEKLNAKMAAICLSKASESGESIDAFNALLEARKVDLTASKILVDALQASLGVSQPPPIQISAVGHDELARLAYEEAARVDAGPGCGEFGSVVGSVPTTAAEAANGDAYGAGPALGAAVGDDARGRPVAASCSSRPPVKLAHLRV
jgi:hypothetical protein